MYDGHVKKGSGPVSGIGRTSSFFGVHLACFCVYLSSSGHIGVQLSSVVVVVVVKRGSGPVSGIGSTRSFFGVHLDCVCEYFSSSGNIA